MKLLTIWAALTVIVYFILNAMGPETKDALDPYIVGLIGVTSFNAATLMLVFTRNEARTVRGTGAMGMFYGAAVLYIGALVLYALPGTKGLFDEISDTARSFLIVGCPMVNIGIAMWVWHSIRSQSDEEAI